MRKDEKINLLLAHCRRVPEAHQKLQDLLDPQAPKVPPSTSSTAPKQEPSTPQAAPLQQNVTISGGQFTNSTIGYNVKVQRSR
jgi:hypothetical protein